MACRTPCPSCPWRVDQHAQAIPNFDLELAKRLVHTASGQLGAPIFACHQSRATDEVPCVGWLARHGWDSIAVRLRLAHGEMRVDEMPELDETWPELHETVHEVIAKLTADCA